MEISFKSLTEPANLERRRAWRPDEAGEVILHEQSQAFVSMSEVRGSEAREAILIMFH